MSLSAANAEFITMCANNFDAMMKVVEAAKNVIELSYDSDYGSCIEITIPVYKALNKALEDLREE